MTPTPNDEASLKARLARDPRDADTLGALGELLLRKTPPVVGQLQLADIETGIAYLRDAINAGNKSPQVIKRFVMSLGKVNSIPRNWNIDGAISIAFESGILPPPAFIPAVNALLNGLAQHKGSLAEALQATNADDNHTFAELMRLGRLRDTLAHPALSMMMRTTVFASVEWELMFTSLRRYYLEIAANPFAISIHPSDRALCYALAAQCFLNEYAFWASADEELKCELLAESFGANLAENPATDPFIAAVLACYRPLTSQTWARKLAQLYPTTDPNGFGALIQTQILEPAAEREIAESIPMVGKITDKTSCLVKNQYEENPYPRWVRPGFNKNTIPFSEMIRTKLPNANLGLFDKKTKPEILIAGCGTGLHIFHAIRGYEDWELTAIDISSASLAYAQRQIDAFNLPNVSLALCDILNVSMIGKTFDIIECGGVLHHMASPIDGWRALVDVLRPGGVMSVGLYSATARRAVLAAQSYVKRKNYSPNRLGIRRFRRDVIESTRKSTLTSTSHSVSLFGSAIKNFNDFYSLSMCRDLVFHVQEKNFSLEEIKDAIAELNLHFLGFRPSDSTHLKPYFFQFPNDPTGTNLENWIEFEKDNPDIFVAMYQFDVQKPAN